MNIIRGWFWQRTQEYAVDRVLAPEYIIILEWIARSCKCASAAGLLFFVKFSRWRTVGYWKMKCANLFKGRSASFSSFLVKSSAWCTLRSVSADGATSSSNSRTSSSTKVKPFVRGISSTWSSTSKISGNDCKQRKIFLVNHNEIIFTLQKMPEADALQKSNALFFILFYSNYSVQPVAKDISTRPSTDLSNDCFKSVEQEWVTSVRLVLGFVLVKKETWRRRKAVFEFFADTLKVACLL